MRTLEVRHEAAGLYLPELDLHLDPSRAVPRAFVSHAHADHASPDSLVGSGEVFASRETLALCEARAGARVSNSRVIAWDGTLELGASGKSRATRLSLAPAGHVLGAAQLVVDHGGGRLVYTGDYQTGAGCTHLPGAPVPCDELIIESTFALPIFRFPDRPTTRAQIVAWCRTTLEAGQTPVLLAHALGKAQELVRSLVDADVRVIAHGAVYRVCQAYEALGVALGIGDGKVLAYADEKRKEKGAKGIKSALNGVLIAPPRARATPMIKGRADAVVAYVSGWAQIDAAVERLRAHAGFVLSDHADHDDLLATVRTTGARRVVSTLGPDAAVLARILNASIGVDALAIDAQALDERDTDLDPAEQRK